MSIWKKVHINSGTTYLYKTDNHLGFGSYSEVYRGSKEGSDEQVAIKVVYKPRAGDKYLDEPRIHKEMSSDPNIVRLLHTFQTETNLYLVTELCNGGTLRDMLNKSSNGRIEFHMAVEYLAAIVDALYTVHSKGVTHRDIKPENLLFKDGKIKLGDFGSATYDKMSTSYKGTLDYLAPEMMLDEINYDNKVDIWALGIVFFEMLYGEKPYMWNNEKKTFEELKVSTRIGKPLKDCYVSKEAKDLLRKMLTVDPEKRITIDKVKEHALFMKHQDMKDDAYCLIKSLKDLLEDEAQGEYYLSLLKEKKQLEIYFEETMNKDLDDAIIIDESTIERLQ